MKIQLSDHFTYKRLIRFVLPSIVMMVFTSVYGVVDGLFVSNYAGKTPFAAVNLIMPVIMIMGTVGLMIGTGGSAIVSKTLGEGKKKASEYFSMLVYTSIILGVLFTFREMEQNFAFCEREPYVVKTNSVFNKLKIYANTSFVFPLSEKSYNFSETLNVPPSKRQKTPNP